MEGIHSSSGVSHPHVDAGTYTNMTLETVEDVQARKASCFQPCDVDRRSILHFMLYVATYITNHHTGHITAGTDSKLD